MMGFCMVLSSGVLGKKNGGGIGAVRPRRGKERERKSFWKLGDLVVV